MDFRMDSGQPRRMKFDARKDNGGARQGAGRKPNTTPKKYRKFLLTDEQYEMAKSLGGSPWLQGQLNLQIKARPAAAEKSEAENE